MSTESRPRVLVGGDGVPRVAGVRCGTCREVAAFSWPRCPNCGAEVAAAEFGPEGIVWSATVVRIPIPGRPPPYALAYVDLDDGPRVLAHLDEPARIGTRVRLLEQSEDRDLRAEALT